MRVWLVSVLLVLLTACGGGDDEAAPATTDGETAAATKTEPASAAPAGTPVPEALSGFRCERNASGEWNALGVVANPAKSKAVFQVTVYVGVANGGEEQAATTEVTVAAGGSAEFSLKRLPATDPEGPCHVQVLRRG
jgi:hypothetical protein